MGGDSGGPLVRVVSQSDGGPDIHYHVGAVSYGALCPEALTGIYARTSGMVSWIDRAMCQLNSVDCKDASDDSESEDDNSNDNDDGPDCAENKVKLVIKVLTDFYSIESEWYLEKNSGGNKWTVVKREELGADVTEFTTNMCLDENTRYRWTITDTLGDGLCDPFGNCGSFSITLDGKVISSSNGDFEFEFVKTFRTPRRTPQTDKPTVTRTKRPTKRPRRMKKPKGMKKANMKRKRGSQS